jgi:hypothetical protein
MAARPTNRHVEGLEGTPVPPRGQSPERTSPSSQCRPVTSSGSGCGEECHLGLSWMGKRAVNDGRILLIDGDELALVGMKGLVCPPNQWGEGTKVPLPRDVVFLPDAVVEGGDVDLPAALRPMFDALWQCLGDERSQNYDPTGAWKGKIR